MYSRFGTEIFRHKTSPGMELDGCWGQMSWGCGWPHRGREEKLWDASTQCVVVSQQGEYHTPLPITLVLSFTAADDAVKLGGFLRRKHSNPQIPYQPSCCSCTITSERCSRHPGLPTHPASNKSFREQLAKQWIKIKKSRTEKYGIKWPIMSMETN